MWKSLLFILLYFFVSIAVAHSGRTDAYGGHNKTSDGTYHFHNSGTMGNDSGGWSIFIWLLLLFILYIIGSFIWSYFNEGEGDKTPISNVRRKDSNPASATRSSETKKRGQDSTAARAARETRSSETKKRGQDSTAARAARETSSSDAKTRSENSTAAKAARAASSSDTKSRSKESTAVKAARAATSTSTNASEAEDLYFDNTKKLHKESPPKDDSNDEDDLYFDNIEKK